MEKLKSIKLLQVYNEVLQVESQLDATFLNLLKTSEGDVPANIKRRMEGIENKEYVVLVAGALTFYHHSKFFFLTQFDCDRSRDHRVLKWWRHKNEISEIMGFVKIFWKNNVQEAYLPKMSISGQIVSEIVAQLYSEISIQTLLIFFWVDPKKI